MPLSKIPNSSSLVDSQFIQVSGPDSLLSGYQYDAQTKSLWAKESQVLAPGFHGPSHIAEDPVPNATCDSPGLMSPDDKCKLDALTQTRLGILGFSGAGFPDDGGFLQGDVIFAAGSEFISLERVGSIVRFTVDSPLPLNCECESCAQIFWVQDETDVASIRPPSCAGKLPGVNSYGEMKVYLMPESLIVDPANPSPTLNTKGEYPSLVFKRYDDALTPGEGEFDLVLKRDPNDTLTSYVGWSMTPGPLGVPECVWFMGDDNVGNRIRFDLNPNTEAGLLGNLLYKGHNLTKAMAVITDYTSTVLATNQYIIKYWDVVGEEAVGDEITATNIWQYDNPEGPDSGPDAKGLVLDRTIGLLSIGTLVDLWFFQVAEVNGEPIRRYFFRQKPSLKDCDIWTDLGGTEFGDILVARTESSPDSGETDKTESEEVNAKRDIERSIWGLTGFEDPLMLFEDAATDGTSAVIELNTQHRAVIDETLPGLVVEDSGAPNPFSERPVFLWNRNKMSDSLVSVDIGRPDSSTFPPYDILLHAPIDQYTNIYLKVLQTGQFSGSEQYWIKVKGANWHELPEFGAIRLLRYGSAGTGGDDAPNTVWNFDAKLIFPDPDDDAVVLVGQNPYPGDPENTEGVIGDIVELLHQDYSAPCVRIEFDITGTTIEVQFKVGTLDMTQAYESELVSDDVDDYVRGMSSYAVSSIYSQSDFFTGVGTPPSVSVDGWVVYDGGAVISGTVPEYWNRLEIMQRGNQLWIWWNDLLIPPNASLSGALPDPNPVNTPYFPIESPAEYGKFGMRLWPGAKVRRARVRSGARGYNEFQRGQLLLS